MKQLIRSLMAASLLLLLAPPSYAQVVSAKTVSVCGTPGNTPVIGNPYPLTQDTTGVLCTNASGGGGGGGAVTVVDGGDVTQGAKADAAWALSGDGTLVAVSKAAATVLGSKSDPAASSGTGGSWSIESLMRGLLNAALDTTAVNIAGTGTAGTPNAGVVSIQGISGGFAVPVSSTTLATAAKQATLDGNNAAIVPQSGAATLTGTNLTLNTLATICPTATNPVTTEIYFVNAGVGVGLNGQTLTTATPGTTTTSSPDFVSTAGQLYVAPVGISTAITGYGAAGVVRCTQRVRQ